MAAQRTIIAIIPEKQVRRVDRHAKSISAGAKPNRSHAIRVLLDHGLEAVTRGEAGSALPSTRRRA